MTIVNIKANGSAKGNYAAVPTLPDEPSTVGSALITSPAVPNPFNGSGDGGMGGVETGKANVAGGDVPDAVTIAQKRGNVTVMETPVDADGNFGLPEATEAYIRAQKPIERPEGVHVDCNDGIFLSLSMRPMPWADDAFSKLIFMLVAAMSGPFLAQALLWAKKNDVDTSFDWDAWRLVMSILDMCIFLPCILFLVYKWRARQLVITAGQDEITVETLDVKCSRSPNKKTLSLLDADRCFRGVCCKRQVKETKEFLIVTYAINILWDDDVRTLHDNFTDMVTALYIHQEIERFLRCNGMVNSVEMGKANATGSDGPVTGSIFQQRGNIIVMETPVEADGKFRLPEATDANIKAQNVVEQPKTVDVDRNDDICLTLSIRLWRHVHFVSFVSTSLTYALIMLSIFGVTTLAGDMCNTDYDCDFGLLYGYVTCVYAVGAVYLFHKWVNRRIITVSQDGIMVDTLPFKCFGCLSKGTLSLLDADRCFQEVCCRRHVNKTKDGLIIWYAVHILWEDNGRTLIATFPDMDTALYIQQEIERFIVRNIAWRIP